MKLSKSVIAINFPSKDNKLSSHPSKEYYTIIGVNPDASSEEIRKAYLDRTRIIHPDRFSQNRQNKEWTNANEMLKELNEAYSVLKDVRLREAYDKSRLKPEDLVPGKRDKNSDLTKFATGKYGENVAFLSLPKDLQNLLLKRQLGETNDCLRIKSYSTWAKYAVISFLLILFALPFVFVDSPRWSQSTINFLLLAYGFVSAIVAWLVLTLLEYYKAEIKPYLYVTKMYLVSTQSNQVSFWPLIELADVKVTHKYRNGGYIHSEIVLKFPGTSEIMHIDGSALAENFVKSIDEMRREFVSQYNSGNVSYFKMNNDFIDVDIRAKASMPVYSWRFHFAGFLIAIAVSSVIIWIAALLNSVKHIEVARHEPVSLTQVSTPEYAGQTSSMQRHKYDSILASLPKIELPKSGQIEFIRKRNLVAPLKINAEKGQNFLVKLVDLNSNQDVMTIFVRSGTQVEVKAPLGTFEIRYASGEKWYGPKYYFGPNTSFSRADKQFNFYETENGVNGYSIQLYKTADGNLSTININEYDF